MGASFFPQGPGAGPPGPENDPPGPRRMPARRLLMLLREAVLTDVAVGRSDAPEDDDPDDPWLLCPEEVESRAREDPDELSTDGPAEPRRSRPPSAIYFEPAIDEASSLDALRVALPPGVRLAADPMVRNGLRARIARLDSEGILSDEDLAGADKVEEVLEAIAVELLERQHESLKASSMTAALLNLAPLSQRYLAKAANVDSSWLSRRKGLVVGTGWGQVPLEFFWWRTENMTDALWLGLPEFARLLRSTTPPPPAKTAARDALRSFFPGGQVDVQYADALRKFARAVMTLAEQSPLIQQYRSSLPDIDASALCEELGITGHGRTVVRMALAGALEERHS